MADRGLYTVSALVYYDLTFSLIEYCSMRDSRLQVAIDNWAPRFVANGVDINDFQRITASLESWDGWCAAWSIEGEAHAEMGEQAALEGFDLSAAQHFWQSAMMYHFGKFMFFHRPAEYRAAHHSTVQRYDQGLPYQPYQAERVEIPYQGGSPIAGILRRPETGRAPVVVLIPGLDSVKEELHAYGDDFLKRGIAVLAIDGPGQGELEFEHAMRPDWEVPLGSIIDYIETRSDLDGSRIGAMGVSVGGHYAARAAAFEYRLSAVITNCTGYNLAERFDQLPILTREAFVHKLKARDESDAKLLLRDFHLHGLMKRVRCPLLVIMGGRDRLFPAENAERMVSEAPRARLLMLPDGNHVCNNVPYKHRPQQADWMAAQLGSVRPGIKVEKEERVRAG
ncbi:MAG: alpha/beta hydrolase family protein [Chloroflexota bacterium]